jgi:hypothetical protein
VTVADSLTIWVVLGRFAGSDADAAVTPQGARLPTTYSFVTCRKIPHIYHREAPMKKVRAMNWLLTDENMATLIVIAGFCLFKLFGTCLAGKNILHSEHPTL